MKIIPQYRDFTQVLKLVEKYSLPVLFEDKIRKVPSRKDGKNVVVKNYFLSPFLFSSLLLLILLLLLFYKPIKNLITCRTDIVFDASCVIDFTCVCYCQR